VSTVSFPRYGEPSAAPITEYLQGRYGSAEEVGPYRASILYAVDRWAASLDIRRRLEAGEHVIADRYVLANIGHQGGKITDLHEREKFIAWVIDLEHGTFGIPKPDLNLILHVPADITLGLMAGRGGADDIHERDVGHLRAAENSYLLAAKRLPDTVIIECVRQKIMLPRERVHELVWQQVSKVLDA
jgi:dTMP kinase